MAEGASSTTHEIPTPNLPGRRSIRIFILSYNMAAREMFATEFNDKLGRTVVKAEEVAKLRAIPQIPLDCDLYIIGVQECISDAFFQLVGLHLRDANCQRQFPPDDTDRVWGRGDGSFIRPKFTGIACYVSASIKDHFKLLKPAAVPMGVLEGSKGGAALALRVFDTTLVFISTHMSSNTHEQRLHHYQTLIERLGARLGARHFQLLEQFGHVIWFGDMNYRITGVEAHVALELLRKRDMAQLWRHDGLRLSMTSAPHVFYRFREPAHLPNFFPTYKKKKNRELPSNLASPTWADDTYLTMYKEPFYKGGNTKPRVPSWCDRVVWHSLADRQSHLTPARAPNHPTCDVYGAINDHLGNSDHTAIYSAFDLSVQPVVPLTRAEMGKSFTIRMLSIKFAFSDTDFRIPTQLRLLFPAPYEDSNDTPVARIVTSSILQGMREPRLDPTLTLAAGQLVRAQSAVVPSGTSAVAAPVAAPSPTGESRPSVPRQLSDPSPSTTPRVVLDPLGVAEAPSDPFGGSPLMPASLADVVPLTPDFGGLHPSDEPYDRPSTPLVATSPLPVSSARKAPGSTAARHSRPRTKAASSAASASAEGVLAGRTGSGSGSSSDDEELAEDAVLVVAPQPSKMHPSRPRRVPVLRWTPHSNLETFHLVVRAYGADGVGGQCEVAVTAAEFHQGLTREYRVDLTRKGIPVTVGDTHRMLELHFTLQLSAEAPKGASPTRRKPLPPHGPPQQQQQQGDGGGASYSPPRTHTPAATGASGASAAGKQQDQQKQ